MGKNNLKKQKKARRDNDSFDNMKAALMKEFGQKKYEGERDNPKTDRPYKTPYKPGPRPERKKLTTRTDDFNSMIENLINTIPLNGVNLSYSPDRRKMSNGIISCEISFTKSGSTEVETNSTLLVYYTENRSGMYSEGPKQEHYSAHIQVIVKSTGVVLFSRFGSDAIDKSEEYIKSILDNSISFLSKPAPAAVPEKMEEDAAPVESQSEDVDSE